MPPFVLDWSLALRGAVIESGSGTRYEAIALPSVSLVHRHLRGGYSVGADAELAHRVDGDVRISGLGLEGRADYADVMVVASGRSARHVASIADHLAEKVKADGFGRAVVEGEKTGDWAIVDCGDVIVHVFRPEVRSFYDLEAMWTAGAEHRAQAG